MTEKKRRRQETLVEAVRKEPFLTDEALAKRLAVSVQTVRLDRTELGIPELRAREGACHSPHGSDRRSSFPRVGRAGYISPQGDG